MSLNMPFVPGLDLAEGFFREAVSPIVDAVIPGLEYSAALIGSVDLISDNTDLLEDTGRRRELLALYA